MADFMTASEYDVYFTINIEGSVYDVTGLTKQITITTAWRGAPGKLEALLVDDPYDPMTAVLEGSQVILMVNGIGYFKGYIFEIVADQLDVFKITAYDSLRFMQNTDTLWFDREKTAHEIFEQVTERAGVSSRVHTPDSTPYRPTSGRRFHNETFYNMVQEAIFNSNIEENMQYYLRDEFGTLVFTELKENLKPITIGYEELMLSYMYGRSINFDVYNSVKVTRDNADIGEMESWVVYDSGNISKWGKLHKSVAVGEDSTEEYARAKAASLLAYHNRTRRRLKSTFLGHLAIIQAGDGFIVDIPRHGIRHNIWTIRMTQQFRPSEHLCEVEAFITEDFAEGADPEALRRYVSSLPREPLL